MGTVSVKNIETKSQKNWDKKSKKLRQIFLLII